MPGVGFIFPAAVSSGSPAGNLDGTSGLQRPAAREKEQGVGEAEIRECWAKYRRAVHIYSEILNKLKAARDAAEGVPILRRAQRHIDQALQDITSLGDLMSLVPELATRLQEQAAQLRFDDLMRTDETTERGD
jgi:hypothetical protein